MKTVYKIYVSALEEKKVCEGFAYARPIQCPDFENENEAEFWLKDQKVEPVNSLCELKTYFFIQKTFLI